MDRYLNIVGLVFNFVGALLMWKFVEPSPIEIRKNAAAVLSTETVGNAIEKGPKYRKLTRAGLLLVSMGFLLQLVAAVLY